jgi:hypothetical protein
VETGNNKGALRCIVQNLRYFEKGDYIYKLILFGKKGERTIHAIMGNLLVNRQGNGEPISVSFPLMWTERETPIIISPRPSLQPHPPKMNANRSTCA